MLLIPRRNHPFIAAFCFTALGAGLALLAAGPLNPPVGSVSPSYKTLAEIEPRIAINATNTPGDNDATPSLFKITQPGSYYLTGNITGVVGKYGIEIAASGVMLDLNGFDLTGVPGMGAFDGVRATVAGLSNIAVVNGSVRNWGQDGVNLGDSNTVACRVEGIRAGGNARMGILTGTNTVVSKCAATGGLIGVYAGLGSTITECSATGAQVGIQASGTNAVSNCAAYLNNGIGINAGTGTVDNCTASNNSGSGINVSVGGTVSNCLSIGNSGTGISANNGCTVIDCKARMNTQDGISVSGSCTIRGNICTSNGNNGDGAGIRVSGTRNRIEGNTCTEADRGIEVIVGGNFISRNVCSGNTTNWNVGAGNVCLVVQGVAGAAVTGNTGGAAPGSTDPNANFTY